MSGLSPKERLRRALAKKPVDRPPVICMGGMMNAAGFGAMFVGLHRLIFTNSNWLLNPATDILIRMMPQALFETALRDVLGQFALAFALAVLLLAAAYAVVSGMVKRQLTQTEERP